MYTNLIYFIILISIMQR